MVMVTERRKMATKKKKSSGNKISQGEIILALIVAAILRFCGALPIGAISNSVDDEIASEPETAMSSHAHNSLYEVSSDQAPSVEIDVIEDAVSGYNVRIVTDKFTFTPESVNQANITGQGHAHLYVDDVKIGRVYSEWTHYNENFEGTKEFKVTLNSNDHSD